MTSSEPAEPTVGLDEPAYLALFLDGSDLPAMHPVQDSRLQGADPGDAAFGNRGGLHSGFQVWMDETDAPLWRLVDIRWVFPSAADAGAYHRESLRTNSEGHPPVPSAPLAGESCSVFGGTETTPFDPNITMTTFYYVFRVHNVVVKLFVAQGPALPADTLVPGDVASVAERIVQRLSVQ